eukprot:Em0017g630a
MDKSASCKIFGEYVDSLFPIGGKCSRSVVIRQDFAKRIVDHLKGKQDPDASFRHFVKKGGFALLDIPSAGIRDVLVVSLKEEKQNLNDRTMMKASRRVATVEEFIAYWSRFTQKTVYMRAQKRHLPRSVVVPDARLKELINEEDLELTGEMESAQDTSDVDRTTVEMTLQHNSSTTIQHSSLDSTHDSSPTVLDTVQHSSPSIHNSTHDSAPTVLDNIHHSPPSVKESMFDSSPTDVTSNDSKLCDGVSRCCNSESETEEKDKTLHILDSEAKTEDGRQKQLATIEKHRLVREKADMNSVPVPSGPTGDQKRLLSRSSGLYVHIGENGALDGGGSPISAAVFTVTFRDTYYEFESDGNTKLFLEVLNVTENDEHFNKSGTTNVTIGNASTTVEEMTVSVGRVSAESSYWKWTMKTFDDDTHIQVINIQRTDCYLAFNEDSSLAGPCNMSDDDPRTFFDLRYIDD